MLPRSDDAIFPPPSRGQEVKGTRDRDTSFAILSGQYCPVILPCVHRLEQIRGDLPFPSAFPLLSLAVLRQPPSSSLSRQLFPWDSSHPRDSGVPPTSPREHCPRKYLSRYPRISANILRDVVSWSPSTPTARLDQPSPRVSPHQPRRSDRPPPPTTTVQYLYYPNRTLSGNTDMIAIPFIYLQLYGRARLYTTLGTYQNRRPPCNGSTDDAIIIFSDKPTIPSLSYPSRFVAIHGRLQYAATFRSWTTRNAFRAN